MNEFLLSISRTGRDLVKPCNLGSQISIAFISIKSIEEQVIARSGSCCSHDSVGRRSDDLQTLTGYDLDSKSLQVSPAMFAPNRLCSCNPGWSLGCLGGGFAVQDISLDANTVELQGNYGTYMLRLQSATGTL